MKKYCILLLFAAATGYITSCEQASTVKTANNKTSDSAATFNLTKARDWIENDNKKFGEEIKKGDSNALALHYAPDALLMFNNRAPVKGKDIAAAWGGAIRMGMKEAKLTTVDLVGNADLLAETGMYEIMGNGNKVLDSGKYVVVWRPANDGWKIYRDISNSNMPAHQ
jgi:ketosteroid isomerase-like protein